MSKIQGTKINLGKNQRSFLLTIAQRDETITTLNNLEKELTWEASSIRDLKNKIHKSFSFDMPVPQIYTVDEIDRIVKYLYLASNESMATFWQSKLK